MEKIRVNTQKPYDIIVGENILDGIGNAIVSNFKVDKIAIITDDVVDKLYSQRVINSLVGVGKTPCKYVFANGEKSKNINTYYQILNFLADNEFSRGDLIIALGGGVVGDMAGFASSTFMRGIKCVQVPTTLLAQVDSSVGGKTAIDLPQGKNLVGTFFQPSLVYCDTSLINSLPKQIYLDGMGEVAKYAILDERIFELVEKKESLLKIITACINCKREIVERDEFEKGDRKLLNLGHTVAHTIEKLSNYSISHGMAVGMGLYVVLNSALKNGYIDQLLYKKIYNCIINCVGKLSSPYTVKQMADCVIFDKKRDKDCVNFVAIHGVGNVVVEKIKLELVEEYLSC